MKYLSGSLCTQPLRPANYYPNELVHFHGTGDPGLCQEMVSSLFNFSACRDRKDCPFNGIHRPKVKGNFVAFSGFYYTINALNLSGHFSLDDFNSSMWFFCSHTWAQLHLMLPKFEEIYARSYCFSANFIYYLLIHGYNFDTETWPRIHFQKEVGNSSIAWSLGYMLSLTNMIPAEGKLIQLPLKPALFAGLLICLTATALLCLVFLVYLWIVSRNRKNICHVEHVFIPEWMNFTEDKSFIVLLSRTLFLKNGGWNKDKRQKDFRTWSISREETQRNLWYGDLECFWNILAVVSVKLICPACSREPMGRFT